MIAKISIKTYASCKDKILDCWLLTDPELWQRDRWIIQRAIRSSR